MLTSCVNFQLSEKLSKEIKCILYIFKRIVNLIKVIILKMHVRCYAREYYNI